MLIASTKTAISEVYIPKVDFVNVHDDLDEVSIKMRKYDLEAIPVVDNNIADLDGKSRHKRLSLFKEYTREE